MRVPPSSPFLFALSLVMASPSFAQEEMDPPPPAVQDAGIGDTSLGDKGDIGTADPVDPLQDNPTVQPLPEFKEVPQGEATSPPPPEVQAPVDEPAPQPPPRKARRRSNPDLTTPRAPDDPDFRKEGRFHEIFKTYNAEPTSAEAWEQAAGARRSEVYNVQSGDTLWGLSQTLFGDPNYWPKIWSVNNDEITNPHEIDTWMGVRFFPGDLNEPPVVAVAEAPKVASADESAMLPPAKRRPRVVKKLPESIPIYRFGGVNTPPVDFQELAPPRRPASPNVPLSYDFSEGPLKGSGVIKETELGVKTAAEFQYVFVELSSPGERLFTVVREIGVLSDGGSLFSAKSARMIEVQGEIEVLEPVSERGNLFRAIVRRNLTTVEVGSLLVPGSIQSVNVSYDPPAPGPRVRVVGGRFGPNRNILENEALIFLSGGSTAGLQEGQSLSIYSNVKRRNPDSQAVINERPVGVVKVVKVGANFATAYVTQAWDDIAVGDFVGGGSEASPSGSGEGLDFDEGAEDEVPAPNVDQGSSGSGSDDLSLDEEDDALEVPAPTPDSGEAPQEGSDEDDELSL